MDSTAGYDNSEQLDEREREQYDDSSHQIIDDTGPGQDLESDNLYRSVFHAGTSAMAIVESDMSVFDANPGFVALSGRKLHGIKGEDVLSTVLPREDCRKIKDIISQNTPEAMHGWETVLEDQQGRRKHVLISVNPVPQSTRHIITLRDISNKKNLESLQRHTQRLKALGILAAGISHDFNNIIGALLMNIELALHFISKGGDGSKFLHRALESGNRAKDLVAQILSYSRQTDRKPTPVRILPLVKEFIKFLKSILPATIEVREDLCEITGPVIIDPTEVHQLLLNVCSRAVQNIGDGTGTLSISLREEQLGADTASPGPELRPGPYLVLTVSETRPGMDAGSIQSTPDPFSITGHPDDNDDFLLDLAVTERIIRNSGGMITAESISVGGTHLSVYLPIVAAKMDRKGKDPANVTPGTGRILIIDDEEELAVAYRNLLDSLGYEVAAFTEARKALDAFLDSPFEFDLVLTDLALPEMSGLELIRAMRSVRADIPVILCTGHRGKITSEKIDEYGISDLLIKPFHASELSQHIRQVLDSATFPEE